MMQLLILTVTTFETQKDRFWLTVKNYKITMEEDEVVNLFQISLFLFMTDLLKK